MKIIKPFLSIPISILIAYLTWLLWHWISPYYIFTIERIGVFWSIVVWLLGISGVLGLVSFLQGLLIAPIVWLKGNTSIAKYINIIPFIFFGYSSVMLPYNLSIRFTPLIWTAAILFSLTVGLTYIICIYTLLQSKEDL